MRPSLLLRACLGAVRLFLMGNAFVVLMLFAPSAFGAVTLTPQNGIIHYIGSGQPKFTIGTSLTNPQTATDGNGNSMTDSISQVHIYSTSGFNTTINVSSYDSLWTDPRGQLSARTETYTVEARGLHWTAYSNWVEGHTEVEGHWEPDCHDEEDGYWDDDGNWNVTGSHEVCDGSHWVEDNSYWVPAHYEYGLTGTWTTFGIATITFYITSLDGTTSVVAYNGTFTLAAPATPRFSINTQIMNPRTVTDGEGRTATEGLIAVQVEVTGAVNSWTYLNGAISYSGLWTDPRSNLGPGTQNYIISTWFSHCETFDHGWVEGHWEESGHWGEDCHEEEDGYWDGDGNWVVTGTHTDCDPIWVVDSTSWVPGYHDTGITYTWELLPRQQVTAIITTGTAQTITFPNVGAHTWGSPPFSLNATASSGLPVSYTVVSGPATVSGNMLTITGVGAITVKASQWGDATYGQAADVLQTFNAGSGLAQTISFPAIPSHAYGDAPFAVSASSSSQLPVSLSVTGGLATISTTTVGAGGSGTAYVTLTGAGTVTITATQRGNETYGPATPVSRTISISKASQTILFSEIPNHVDGDAPFGLEAVASPSLLPVSFSVVSGPATISGNAVTVNAPGTVTIRASQAGDERFLEAPAVDRTFTVGLGPNGHTLTVINGTAANIGGNAGTWINISATIPSGQYFTGWTLDAGDAHVANIAFANTQVLMGSQHSTVRATFSTSPPSYNVAWTEINTPSSVTAQVGSWMGMAGGGIITNTGTAAWPSTVLLEVRNMANELVGYCGFPNGAANFAVGGKAPVMVTFGFPTTVTAGTYMFRLVDYTLNWPNLTQIGPSHYKTISVTTRTGAPPEVSSVTVTGTVGGAMNFSTPATNSPTSYTVIGTLPTGLSINASTGAITGTPTQAGDFAVTVNAANGYGNGVGAAIIHVYPNVAYPLAVTSGVASVATLTVGSSATLNADAIPPGQIFNGWSISSGTATFANWRSSSTTVRLDRPGNLSVQANYITGNPLTVENGVSTPLGGVSGAVLTIAANPDPDGTFFSRWSTNGPGAIGVTTASPTTFTMGSTAATVTANYEPGYRVQMFGGTAGANGGVPGTDIAITGNPSPGPGYEWGGFWIEGPGYLMSPGGGAIVGMGTMRINSGWWPTSNGALPRSLVWTIDQNGNWDPGLYRYKNEQFTVIMMTDYGGYLPPKTDSEKLWTKATLIQQLDYSTDGGNTWQLAVRDHPQLPVDPTNPDDPLNDTYYPWRRTYTKTGGFPNPGRVVFRQKSELGSLLNPVYSYKWINILNISAATILESPTSLTVPAGQDAEFSFRAVGNGGGGLVEYEWRKDGAAIAGKSGMTDSNVQTFLTIPKVDNTSQGVYTVAIRSGVQQTWISSNPATLTVKGDPPQITRRPTPIAVAPGASATFLVGASGSPTLKYQWWKDGAAITGATRASYTIPSAQTGDAGMYSVVVSNDYPPAVTSVPVPLIVNSDSPRIITAPTPASINLGASSSAVFSVVAGGTAPLTYVWQKGEIVITSATGPSLPITNASVNDEGDYTVTVTNTAGSITSDPVHLTVVVPNPYGDSDNDGILNKIELLLGLDPGTGTSIDTSNPAQLKVHKP